MIEILGPFIDEGAHSRWTAPSSLDDVSRDLVEFGENLYYSLRDHLHGELDCGAGQFVRDDAVEYELWLAKAAPGAHRAVAAGTVAGPLCAGRVIFGREGLSADSR